MGYTPLHRDLLVAVQADAVLYNTAGRYHRVAGFRVHESVEQGLGWLLLGGYTVFGDDEPDGTAPVLPTPLGVGALRRWTGEQELVERTGGQS